MDSHRVAPSPPSPMNEPMKSWDLKAYVLKIRYLGVLRRLIFQASNESELSVSDLERRAKGLFFLSAAASVAFTYVDSDGDVVALADDRDLEDALVLQALNPLRITMVGGEPESGTQDPPSEEEEEEEEDTFSLPDLTEKHQLEDSDFVTGEQHAEGEQTEGVVKVSEESDGKSAKTDDHSIAPGLEPSSQSLLASFSASNSASSSSATDHGAESDEESDALANKTLQSSPLFEGGLQVERALSGNSDSDVAPVGHELSNSAGKSKSENLQGKDTDGERGDLDASSGSCGAYEDDQSVKSVAGSQAEGRREKQDGAMTLESNHSEGGRNVHYGIRCDGCGMIPITGPRFKSCKISNYDLCLGCFDARDELDRADYVEINRRFDRLVHSSFDLKSLANAFVGLRNPAGEPIPQQESESESESENSKPVIHLGVQCDECGVTPIEGPRFKSSKRFNYDLCLICYERSGSDDTEYHRLDNPRPHMGLLQITPIMGRILRLADQKLSCICERWIRLLDPRNLNSDQPAPAAGKDEAKSPSRPGSTSSEPMTSTVGGVKEDEKMADAGRSFDGESPLWTVSTSEPMTSTAGGVMEDEKMADAGKTFDGESEIVPLMVGLGGSHERASDVSMTDHGFKAEGSTASSLDDGLESCSAEASSEFSFTFKELAGLEAPNASAVNGQEDTEIARRDEPCVPAALEDSQESVREAESSDEKRASDFQVPEPTSDLDSSAGPFKAENLDAIPTITRPYGLVSLKDGPGSAPDMSEEDRATRLLAAIRRVNEEPENKPGDEGKLDTPVGEEGGLDTLAGEEGGLDTLVDEEGGLDTLVGEEGGLDTQIGEEVEFAKQAGEEEHSGEDSTSLEMLMAKLEGMGFSDEALNKELLKKHNLHLRSTLDDLCAAEDEWDQMLGDLQEMGFYDENMNRSQAAH